MIVEDDSDILFLYKLIFKKEGYEVIDVSSVEECFEKLDKTSPDLVIIDIMMPGMDGLEACKKIKEKNKQNPRVILISARCDEEAVRKSFEYAKADAYLSKPVSRKKLIETIRRFI